MDEFALRLISEWEGEPGGSPLLDSSHSQNSQIIRKPAEGASNRVFAQFAAFAGVPAEIAQCGPGDSPPIRPFSPPIRPSAEGASNRVFAPFAPAAACDANADPSPELETDIRRMAAYYQATAQELDYMLDQARRDPAAWRLIVSTSKERWGWGDAEVGFHPWLSDQRPCSACTNLRDGFCLAARNGELKHLSHGYSPAEPDRPRRCFGYRPKLEELDQRPGRERWPELARWQDHYTATIEEAHHE